MPDLRRPPVLVGGAVLAGLALLDLATTGGPTWSLLVHVAVAALVVAALLYPERRRRAPVAATAVALSLVGTLGMVLAGGTIFGLVETAALLLLLVERWRHAATRADRWLTALVVVALLLLPVRLWDADAVTFVALMVAVVSVVVAVATALRAQDTRRETAVAAVRRSEREEIARELHDVVAHHVTGIVVATQAARTVITTDPRAVAQSLVSIEAAGSEALVAMRRLVEVLRAEPGPDARLAPTTGIDDLPDLVQRFRDSGAAGTTDMRVPSRAPGSSSGVPVEVQAAVYRVVQESLTNVSRHASGAELVVVAVARSAGALTVAVTDSGAGARAGRPDAGSRHGGGFGVVGMRERIEALGGTLVAGPTERGGWSVHAAVPLRSHGSPAGTTVGQGVR